MQEQQTMTVDFGTHTCKLQGFENPAPVLEAMDSLYARLSAQADQPDAQSAEYVSNALRDELALANIGIDHVSAGTDGVIEIAAGAPRRRKLRIIREAPGDGIDLTADIPDDSDDLDPATWAAQHPEEFTAAAPVVEETPEIEDAPIEDAPESVEEFSLEEVSFEEEPAPEPVEAAEPEPVMDPEPEPVNIQPEPETGSDLSKALSAAKTASEEVPQDIPAPQEPPVEDVPQVNPLMTFAERFNPSDLTECICIAAAYIVKNSPEGNFTRADALVAAEQLSNDGPHSYEEKIKAFGSLTRDGAFLKSGRGEFILSPSMEREFLSE